MSYPDRKCKLCKEDVNMYGGCKCNGYTTAFNSGKPLDIDELKRLYDSVGPSYGYVLMPSVNGFNVFKIEVGKLRKLASQAFADDAVETPVYVAQQPQAVRDANAGDGTAA